MSRVVPKSAGVLLGAALLALSGCDLGPKTAVQMGPRGVGQQHIVDDSDLRASAALVQLPTVLPPAGGSPPGPLPWQNVQVLNDISVAEFNRTMIAMSTWVAGTGNCAYCHDIRNLAADTTADGRPIYTKLVSRRMIQMTRHINASYQPHVANTGVTCYTCHRGKPLPNGLWFYGKQTDYLRHYLDRDGARVQTLTVEPTSSNRSSVKQAEWTYALMISQSQSLGVNCTYCHNSRNFNSWEQAPPQRVTAYHGTLMLRDLNTRYLAPLQSVYPQVRLGPMGDAPKAQCSTCHNGAYKPLYGAQMARDYPAFWGRADWNGVQFPSFTPSTPRADSAMASPAAGAAISLGAPGLTRPSPGTSGSPHTLVEPAGTH